MSPTSSRLPRRLAAVVSAAVVITVTSALLAGPASAVEPEGWPVNDDIDGLFVLGVLVAIPVLLAVVIGVLVYAPAMIRGERVAPGAPSIADQWLGGPRKSAGELAAPDTAESEAGGASGRW